MMSERRRLSNKRWEEANRERYLELRRQSYQRNKERNRARAIERIRRDPEAHRERARRQRAETEWATIYAQSMRVSRRKWKAAHPEAAREYEARRRARQAGNGIFLVTRRDWERLLSRYDHRCAYCGEATVLHQDHLIPIARGGRHSIGNLVPACIVCNGRKRALLPVEFRRRAA